MLRSGRSSAVRGCRPAEASRRPSRRCPTARRPTARRPAGHLRDPPDPGHPTRPASPAGTPGIGQSDGRVAGWRPSP